FFPRAPVGQFRRARPVLIATGHQRDDEVDPILGAKRGLPLAGTLLDHLKRGFVARNRGGYLAGHKITSRDQKFSRKLHSGGPRPYLAEAPLEEEVVANHKFQVELFVPR